MARPFGAEILDLLSPQERTALTEAQIEPQPKEHTTMNPFKYTNPEAQTNEGSKSAIDALNNKDMLAKSYYAVEEVFVLNDSIPRDLKQNKSKQGAAINPIKTALNLFDSFEEASRYAVQMNRPLVIMEIKPMATSKPQTALVSKVA